jgi:flagellar assembly protein FliH
MSNVIPKEQMSAYQRWELASFDAPPPPTPEEVVARLEEGNRKARLAAYNMGLEEGRAIGIEQGHTQGFEQGHAAGMEKGYADGLEQGRAQAEAERQQLLQVAATFGNEIGHASERIADDVLVLALDLAKAMLKNALAVRPELVLPIVAEAIHYLPSVQQPALLFLHPDDAQLVTKLMGEELEQANWRIIEDAHIERGGCRVETSSNQIDATTTSRWQRISAALGKESDWLAP